MLKTPDLRTYLSHGYASIKSHFKFEFYECHLKNFAKDSFCQNNEIFVNIFTSERLAFNLVLEAFVIEDVRLNPPEIGSALEYPELMSSEDRTL